MGHKIQLTLADTFIRGGSSESYSDVINNTMFELMKDFKGGKKGMEFDEVSEELMNPTLKQRGEARDQMGTCRPSCYGGLYEECINHLFLSGKRS